MYRAIFQKIENSENVQTFFFQKIKKYKKGTDRFIKKCTISENRLTIFLKTENNEK